MGLLNIFEGLFGGRRNATPSRAAAKAAPARFAPAERIPAQHSKARAEPELSPPAAVKPEPMAQRRSAFDILVADKNQVREPHLPTLGPTPEPVQTILSGISAADRANRYYQAQNDRLIARAETSADPAFRLLNRRANFGMREISGTNTAEYERANLQPGETYDTAARKNRER